MQVPRTLTLTGESKSCGHATPSLERGLRCQTPSPRTQRPHKPQGCAHVTAKQAMAELGIGPRSPDSQSRALATRPPSPREAHTARHAASWAAGPEGSQGLCCHRYQNSQRHPRAASREHQNKTT